MIGNPMCAQFLEPNAGFRFHYKLFHMEMKKKKMLIRLRIKNVYSIDGKYFDCDKWFRFG